MKFIKALKQLCDNVIFIDQLMIFDTDLQMSPSEYFGVDSLHSYIPAGIYIYADTLKHILGDKASELSQTADFFAGGTNCGVFGWYYDN